MGKENFINVNINVNGKVHKVRIQEGVGIDKTASYEQDKAWRVKNGSLFCMEEKTETGKYDDGTTWEQGLGIFTQKTTNELKMSEAEFALFKNMADNVNEGGDVLTLSRADINKAQEFFSQGKFTADITKNLPDGFHGSAGNQDMTNGKFVTASVNNYDKNKDALAQATGKKYNYENATIKFYNQVEEDKYLEKYSKMSADGSVEKSYHGGGEGDEYEYTAYTYKDKDGNRISMACEGNYYDPDKGEVEITGASPIMVRFEGTDSEGKRVKASYQIGERIDIPIDYEAKTALGLSYMYDQVKTSTTSDGKEIIELYDRESDNFVLKNVVIKYKNGDKTVMELKDENGNPSKKIIDYTQNDRTIHEDYDKENKLVKKTVDYEYRGIKVHEEHNADGMTRKAVDYEKNGKKIHEDYDKDNKMTKKTVLYDDITEIYDGNNNLIEKRNGWGNTEYYFNGKKCITERGYVVKCADFDVKGQLDKELSEKAKTYRNAYKNEKSKTIAKAIKDQIEGISGNEKTIAMVKGIPADQFIEVLKEYKNVESWLWFDKASLFTDLMDEYFMDNNELTDIAKQAFACYMHNKNGKDVSAEDIKMATYVKAGPNGNLKEYMLTIEEYVTK